MTIDQFRNHGWTPGQSCDYGGTIYKIASVDFAENLVGLANPLCDEGITWVRCENIILEKRAPIVPQPKPGTRTNHPKPNPVSLQNAESIHPESKL